MRALLIFNPASGHNRRRPRFVRRLREFTAENSGQLELADTRAPGHATEMAQAAAAAGRPLVVAVGGDGTVNEVASGLIGTGTALGIVPRGSGNGLARHLRIPLRPEAALRLILDSTARRRAIDTGTADGRPFVNLMGIGFDAELAYRFNSFHRRGFLTYLSLGSEALLDIRSQPYEVEVGGETLRLESIMTVVANSPQFGNEAEVAPGARVDDGQLDLIAVGKVGLVGGAGLALRLFLGNFDRHPRVERRSGTEFVLRRAEPGWMNTDGEAREAGTEIRVLIKPASLHVHVPADSVVL